MPWPIIGHDWAVTLLRQSLAAGRLSHAYLFCGPPQIGKTTLARTLAQALNCARPAPPCGTCSSCLRIASNTHPDVQVIAGRGVGATMQIDQIRGLQREAALAPYEGHARVIILRQMDRATTEAANSLLKLLEEPPSHVVLVLTASDREALPQTLVSRCQSLDLRPVALATIEAALRVREVDASQAHRLARLSGGRVGWAILASRDDLVLQQREQDLNQLFDVLSLDRVGRLDAAWKISRDSVAARRQIELWTIWWRDLLLSCAGDDQHAISVDQMDKLQLGAERASISQAWFVLTALREAAEQLEDNVNPRLALEGLLLRLPYWRLQ